MQVQWYCHWLLAVEAEQTATVAGIHPPAEAVLLAATTTAVYAKGDDDNTLTVWAWDQNFNIKAIETAAEQYKKDHPDFELEVVETSSDDCQTKLTTAANAGDYSTLPDIVLMQDNSYQKFSVRMP